MNFGIGWYGGVAELAVLKTYKDKYKPKMVILYFLAQNDLSDNIDYYSKDNLPTKFKKTVRSLTPKSLLFIVTKGRNLMNNILIKSETYKLKVSYGNQAIKDYEVYLKDYNNEWQQKLEVELGAIEEINQICIEENITLLIVAVTSNEQVYEGDWKRIEDTYPSLKDKTYILEKPNNLVMNFSEQRKIPHLDLLPLFKENPKRLHWEYDGHWNDAGQLFAGDKIEEYIIKNNLIKNEQQ